MFNANFWGTFLAASPLIIGAAYTLSRYRRVFYGDVQSTQVAELEDVTGSTVLLFVLLGAAVLILGIYPNPMLNVFHQSVAHLLKLSIASKI